MLSKDLEATLNDAFRAAKAKRHEFMTVEHLLLALLDNDIAINVLKKVGADVVKLREDLEKYIFGLFECAADAMDRFQQYKKDLGLIDFTGDVIENFRLGISFVQTNWIPSKLG